MLHSKAARKREPRKMKKPAESDTVGNTGTDTDPVYTQEWAILMVKLLESGAGIAAGSVACSE